MVTRLAELDDTPAEPLSEEALKALEGRPPKRVPPPTLDPFLVFLTEVLFLEKVQDCFNHAGCFCQLLAWDFGGLLCLDDLYEFV
jgi:hypothetical protein